MELVAAQKGGSPWNWVPVFDWEIQPNVWYTWADPEAGRMGRCLQKRGREWFQAPQEAAVVLRHHTRSRARDQIGYLLCRLLPAWTITVGATGHDFVELSLPAGRLVVVQGRNVAMGERLDPTGPYPQELTRYRVVREMGPYKGRGWLFKLVLDVSEIAGGVHVLRE